MTTASPKTLAGYLHSYSVMVEYWDDDAGDTDQLLGDREILHDRRSDLTPAQADEMRAIDEKVLGLVAANAAAQGWDIVMLRKTAELIALERGASTLKHAA